MNRGHISAVAIEPYPYTHGDSEEHDSQEHALAYINQAVRRLVHDGHFLKKRAISTKHASSKQIDKVGRKRPDPGIVNSCHVLELRVFPQFLDGRHELRHEINKGPEQSVVFEGRWRGKPRNQRTDAPDQPQNRARLE